MEFITIEFYVLHQNFPIGEFDREWFVRDNLLFLPRTFFQSMKMMDGYWSEKWEGGEPNSPKGRLEGERSAFLHE